MSRGAEAGGGGGVRPHLALIAVQLLFGSWPIVGKIALRALPTTGLVAFRVGGATIAFLILQRALGRVQHIGRKDYARLALYSLLGVVLNQLLFVKGLSLTSSVINATLLGTTIPVFTLLVSITLGYDAVSFRKAFGIIVAATGVIYLVDPMRADFSSAKTVGNILLVANSLSYGAYIAISKDILKRYGALTVITWIFIFGSLITIPVGVYGLAGTPLETAGPGVWLAVLYIILAPTVGAYYLNAWALQRVAPSTVAVYIYLQPLIAFALAPLILGESWSSRAWVASVLIFAGVAIVTWRVRDSVIEEVSEHPDALGH
ncbi:MAG TPA: DMT family transporter [Pyrinomonadaceae bacterium]|jgi:drug/metabolite transporter (DMT)-like permease|nr:DMT family transporter [Pyrinomonadaceae bacterium]